MDAARRARYIAASTLAASGARDLYRYGKNYFSPMKMGKRGMMKSTPATWASRRKKRSQVSKLDHSWSNRLARRHVQVGDAVRDTRTLYYNPLLDITKAAASHNLNTRDRDVINLVGFNIQLSVRNVSTSNLLYNYAIIAIRSGSSPNASNFFRGDGSGDRAVDFGTARTPLENHVMTINDDDYICLAKGRCKVGSANSVDGRDSKIIERWIPCRTQVRYDSVGDPHQNICFVYWCDLDDQNRSAPVLVAQLDHQYRVETVYHEVL